MHQTGTIVININMDIGLSVCCKYYMITHYAGLGIQSVYRHMKYEESEDMISNYHYFSSGT